MAGITGILGPALSKSLTVGGSVFLRTVTHYYIGKIKEVDGTGVFLEPATWVAHQGQMFDCLSKGTTQESEPFPAGVFVFWQACVDVAVWAHKINQK